MLMILIESNEMNIKKVLIITILATAPLHGMQKKSNKIVRNQEQPKHITTLKAMVIFMAGLHLGKLYGELGRNPVINQQSPICTVQQPIYTVNENHLAAFLSHGPAKEMTQCNPLEEIDYLKNAITVKNVETEKLLIAFEKVIEKRWEQITKIAHLENEVAANHEEIAALKEPFYKKLFRR